MNPDYSDTSARPFPRPQKASDLISPERLMQYSRLWQWFFAYEKNARMLLRDAFQGKLDTVVNLDKLTVANPDKQDALGKHRIEDLHCAAELILSDEAVETIKQKLESWGAPGSEIPKNVNITLICEHKFDGSYDIFRQMFEQWAAEIVENMNKAWQKENSLPLLEPVLVLGCVHGPIRFPLIPDLNSLFLETGSEFIDFCRPSLKFFWFDLNKLENIELFTGANPIEYDSVLYMLQGAGKKDVKERLELVLDRIQPYTSDPWVTKCADKLILYAVSTRNGVNARELLDISAQFQPSNGGANMEGKCALELLADMYEEQGIALGEARGEARGIALGEARGKAESILSLLRRRFGHMPKSVENAINRMQDIPVLDSYFEQAIDCQSMEEFEAALPNS